MKTIALTLLAAALGWAQSSSATTTTPAKDVAKEKDKAKTSAKAKNKKPEQPVTALPDPKPAKAQPPVLAVPGGANLVEPNLYRYTDATGKSWFYRQTPFGISKWEDTSPAEAPPVTPSAAPPAQPKGEPVAVTDIGDSYRFEKKTPFGQSTWVRKKSELSDEEKALTGDQQTPSNTTPTDKPTGNQ
jgi:hypothetical protein